MKVVDGLTLSAAHRAVLQPGEFLPHSRDGTHRLPRFFYEIASWEEAKATPLTAHFTLAELTTVDCREADLLFRAVPHFVPCAVSVLGRYLEEFRARVDAPVFISANGGYRSPAHRLGAASGSPASPHLWAAAADIYRIGDTWLDTQKTIERYAAIARSIGPEVFARPFGHAHGETDDHLHIDLGFVTLVPHGCCEP